MSNIYVQIFLALILRNMDQGLEFIEQIHEANAMHLYLEIKKVISALIAIVTFYITYVMRQISYQNFSSHIKLAKI